MKKSTASHLPDWVKKKRENIKRKKYREKRKGVVLALGLFDLAVVVLAILALIFGGELASASIIVLLLAIFLKIRR